MATRALKTSAAIVDLTRRVGFLDASRVLSFLAEWATAMRAHDWEPIDLQEFAEHWRISRASAFRRQALYRRAFPGDQLPNERILAAREVWLREQHTEPDPDALASFVVVLPAA